MEYRKNGEIPTLDNRAAANDSVDKNTRYKQIIEILSDFKARTAKEIAVEMCKRGFVPTTERNWSAPRLTELSYSGIVEPVAKTKCIYTGKTVSVYALQENQTDIYDYLF